MLKKLIYALGLICGAMSPLSAQTIKTAHHATVPARETLDRMGLTLAWQTRLPIFDTRNGLFSVQVIPGKPNPQIVVQTYAGTVLLLDAETGDLLWERQVGESYWSMQKAGANADSIFVTRRRDLHVLNRATGRERIYTVDDLTKTKTLGFPLLQGPSAAPVASDDMLFVCMDNRIAGYVLPFVPERFKKDDVRSLELRKAKFNLEEEDSVAKTGSSLQPVLAWSYALAEDTSLTPPVDAGSLLYCFTGLGDVIALNSFDGKAMLDFRAGGSISSTSGRHDETIYFGSDDGTVHAYQGKILWRNLSGTPIKHSIVVNDKDLFVTPDRVGLTRIDRLTGRTLWSSQPSIENFIACNQKFVYALDRIGNFFVLDALRGTTMAKFDMQDWNVRVTNERTDRIYLASNDGKILCLRARDQIQPLALKLELKPAVAPVVDKTDDKKDDMKDDKKDDKGASLVPDRILPRCNLIHDRKLLTWKRSSESLAWQRETWTLA